MLLSSVVCCLFIEFIGATLATDDSKVLVLDTKNLNKFDHGTDYKVILAKEDSRPPLPRQFTICNSGFFGGLVAQGLNAAMWWFKILTEDRSGGWLLLYSYASFKEAASEDIKQELGFVVNGAWLSPKPDYGSLLFNRWHHICLGVDLDKEVFSFVLNGVKLDDLKAEGMSKGAPTSLDGRLVQDDNGLTVANHMMGNMQVFRGILSTEEMISITAGEGCGRDGDLLAWKDMKWEVKGNIRGWINVTRKEMCAGEKEVFRFVNTQAGHLDDHLSFCNKMHRSKIPADDNEATLNELLDYYRHAAMELKPNDKGELKWEVPGRCVFYWRPYRSNKDGVWTNDYTGEPLNFTNWGPNQDPNDLKVGSCVFGEAGNSSTTVGATNQGGDGKWAVHWPPCNGYGGMCSMCEKPTQPMIRLRGLCRDSDLQNMFTPVSDEKGRLTYVGLSMTNIVYNETTFLWVATNMGYGDVVATNSASAASGLLGTSQWTVYNDSRKCSSESSYKITLTLTSCRKDEFTCADANCIPMENRCDGKVDCDDKTDEEDCGRAVILSSYSKAMTPPPLSGDNQVMVELSMRLQSILNLDEIGQIMFVKYVLLAKWKDPGLKFHNLKRDANQNLLSEIEWSRIWLPRIIFDNTEATEESIMDAKSIIRVLANENFTHTVTDLHHHQNIYIFDGKETELEMSRAYNTEFLCEYSMAWYPFDSQTCHLDFVLDASAAAFVKLVNGTLEYWGPVELAQYFVRKTMMQEFVYRDRTGVRVLVVFGRRLLSNILTVYVPTVLLNTMGHITVYFKPFFFEAIITVNLTVMLVLTTMFISVSNSLPKTSYVKMIDIWLLFNLTIPFAEVLLQTYIEYLRGLVEDKKTINHHGREVEVDLDLVSEKPSLTQVYDLNASHGKLFSVNEEVQREALKEFYESKAEEQGVKTERRLRRATLVAHYVSPIVAVTFAVVYWVIGMINVMYPSMQQEM